MPICPNLCRRLFLNPIPTATPQIQQLHYRHATAALHLRYSDAIATPQPRQSYATATPKLRHSYAKVTPQLRQSYATGRLQLRHSYAKVTPQLRQSYGPPPPPKGTARYFRSNPPRILSAFFPSLSPGTTRSRSPLHHALYQHARGSLVANLTSGREREEGGN